VEDMIDIKLKDGQTGYDIIAEYIRRYWHNNIYNTVIVSMETSYDGKEYDIRKEIACPYHSGVEFLNDWWEGEKFIRLFGIKDIEEIDIFGGLYE
jgi:hypothetical protein